jgi:tetratricopeptide (TPR) repeat protein
MAEHWSSGDEAVNDELRVYESKDYSEVIQFPVELVDRDGVVRRYSYEESLAVYHRRIQSAPWRLEDSQVVEAEIGHCSRRIDQIKRSFKVQLGRPGSAAPRVDPRAVLGEGYEVLMAFYQKVLERRDLTLDGGLEMVVALLEDEVECRVYHLSFGARQGGHLFYVYPFEKPGDQDPRDPWRQATQRHRRYSGAQVERLLLAQQGESAGYILTGTEEIPRGLKARVRTDEGGDVGGISKLLRRAAPGSEPWWPDGLPGSRDDPEWGAVFDRGMSALASEQLHEALQLFQTAVQKNPYHRESYLAVLGVLDTMGNYDEADLYGQMALAHLASDGLIRYRLAILHVRQGRLDEALDAFDEAVKLEPTLYQAPFFASHLMLARLQDLDGATERLRRAAELSLQDEQVVGCLRAAEACRLLRRAMRLGSVAIGVPGLWALADSRMLIGGTALFASIVLMLVAGKFATLLARWTVRRASLLIEVPEA